MGILGGDDFDEAWHDELFGRGSDPGNYERFEKDRPVKCTRCGSMNVFWRKVGDAWKLFEHSGLRMREHKCKEQQHAGFGDET